MFAPLPFLDERFGSEAEAWLGAAATVAGLAWAVWARLHLGRWWSGRIERKEGHCLIRSGPYGLTRHPIYTGMLLAVAGSALAVGREHALVGFVLILAAFWRKLRRYPHSR